MFKLQTNKIAIMFQKLVLFLKTYIFFPQRHKEEFHESHEFNTNFTNYFEYIKKNCVLIRVICSK